MGLERTGRIVKRRDEREEVMGRVKVRSSVHGIVNRTEPSLERIGLRWGVLA